MNPPNGAKPFDLMKAMAGESVVLRDGTKVFSLLYETARAPIYRPLIAISENGHRYANRKDGLHMDNGQQSPYDLFMAPQTKKVWVNLYSTGLSVNTGGRTFPNKEAAVGSAISLSSSIYLKSIEVEIPA